MNGEGRARRLFLTPPAPGACPVCAARHTPREPHDADSLYYQMAFHAVHGRWPTWTDALAHCDETTRADWLALLRELGAATGERPGQAPPPTEIADA